MLKKLLSVTIAAAAALGMTACNERQVATGAAVVGGALIAGAVADSYYNRSYRVSRGYYGGRAYWDRYDGRYYNDGYGRWNRGYGYGYGYGRGYGWNALNETSATKRGNAKVSPQVAVAKKYEMSTAAAGKVLAVFAEVKESGRFQALTKMGLNHNELQAIANGAAPSESAISAAAATLGASTASVKGLLTDVADEYSLAQQQRSL